MNIQQEVVTAEETKTCLESEQTGFIRAKSQSEADTFITAEEMNYGYLQTETL